MQYSSNKVKHFIQAVQPNKNELELQRLRYRLYQCNYLLSAQRDQLDGYRELIEEHISTKDTLQRAQNEVNNLRNQLVQVTIDHQRETRLLLGKTKAVINKEPVDEVDSDQLPHQSQTTTYDPALAHDEGISATVKKNEKIKYRHFMDEFLKVKLDLAKAHSEADWKELRWNRLKIEYGVLLDKSQSGLKFEQPEMNDMAQQRYDPVIILPVTTKNKDDIKLGSMTPIFDDQTSRSNHNAPQLGVIRSISKRLLCFPADCPATKNSNHIVQNMTQPKLKDHSTIRSTYQSAPSQGIVRSISKRLLCMRDKVQMARFASFHSI